MCRLVPAPARKRLSGFTAIELGIALVLAAVLVAIALPAWHGYHLRAARREAAAGLRAIQAAEEAYLLEHGRYARELARAPPGGLGLAERSPSGRYRFALGVGAAATSFTASARPDPQSGAPADPRCQVFTLDQNGLKGALDTAGADRTGDCWR